LAQQQHRITAAGGQVVAVVIDPPERNAAMVDKLGLPFPILSDPDGAEASRRYDVWDDDGSMAKPAVVVVRPDGTEVFRQVGGDFADRITEDELVDRLQELDLPATTQEPPQPGEPVPGPKAVQLATLPAYYRGAKFAVTAVKGRVPEAQDTAERLLAEYDRYLAALDWHQDRR
jgi:hypothetical protein